MQDNELLARLPAKDRRRLLARCELVELTLSDVLCEPGELTKHVYFPKVCFISLLTEVDGHPGVEVGMVGREGMLGAYLALGVQIVPLKALVQGPGAVLRLARAAFLEELAASEALRRLLSRYLYVTHAQLSNSAACQRYHQVGPRLARWLLMSQDRAHDPSFRMTQAFLASMLGVRRVGVTRAASDLQQSGLITYRRGAITVLNRVGLRAAACSCYGSDLRTYNAILT